MAPLASLFVFVLSAVGSALAAPAAKGRTMHGPSQISSRWKQLGSSASTDSIQFTFVLKGKDYAGLTNKMEQISIDGSEWLTVDQLAQYVGPIDEAAAAVNAAIESFGGTVTETSVTGDQITVSTTVGTAAKFFSADFQQYSLNNGPSAHRTHEYTIPAALANYVDDVHPIATFGDYRSSVHVAPAEERDVYLAKLDARGTPSGCSTYPTTPACYKALYQFDQYTPTQSYTSVGIIGWDAQNYNPSDLATWIKSYAPTAGSYSIGINNSNGASNNAGSPGVEASLDTQTIAGIVHPISATYYDIGTSVAGDLFLITFQNFINSGNRPSVITISYTGDESWFNSASANSMCNAAQQLTSLGTTIVVSSGDNGVDSNGDETCPSFKPTYPGGCPYILSVGATYNFSPEKMVDTIVAGFYSGAGFSNIFPIPSWQANQVAAYEQVSGNLNNFNGGGRGFPDVAAQGSAQPVIVNGQLELVGGTSASAPLFAGGLTLLNNLLKQANKPTVGWIHPKIYANPQAFTDITSGGSYCARSGSGSTIGLPAVKGWDAPSGLGTPLFNNLRSVYGV